MADRQLAEMAERACAAAALQEGLLETGVAGLKISRRPAGSADEPMLYEPLVCVVLQGAKETATPGGAVTVSAGRMLVVSHDIPIVSRIIDATRDRPYLALILPLDIGLLRRLEEEIGPRDRPAGRAACALTVHEGDAGFGDGLARLLALSGHPADAAVLAPLVQKELHYRLLTSPQGAVLRALVRRDSRACRISRAIAHLRRHLTEPMPMEELARIAGMSKSSFHAHFKAVTATTPLQFQKELRLIRARERLQAGGGTVSSVAFAVGYESPTQFSREYARRFGATPREDLRG